MSNRARVATERTGAGALLERDEEMRVLDDALAAARGGTGHLVLVEGHAGIGKSRLLDAVVAGARDHGATVLRARASELEADFAFGIALQLFEPLLSGADDERRDQLLGGSAALAAPLLERPTSWGGDEADDRSYPVMHGLFWLLSNLAEAGPVLIAVDDAHWADRPSLRLLLYLCQRLDEMGVTIVAARRLGEPGAPDDLLGQLAADAASRRLRPGPLSLEAARAMLGAGLAGADDEFAAACWRMTEGNPFLLGELVRAVEEEGWEPTESNAARIGTLAPETVLRAVSVRLMRLSDDAAGVARAVAVLGADAQVRHVAALTGRKADTVAAAADALAAGEILRPAGAGAMAFAHPLLASAVYADVGTAERAALHRRAAEILYAEGVAPERVAAHLLPSPGSGEAWVVEVLCASAGRAMALGAPESAASYLCRALEEPPEGGARADVLRQLGISEAATGLPTAVGRLEESLAAAEGPGDRARTLFALGRTLAAAGRHREAVEAFERAAAEGADGDPHLAAGAEAEAVSLGLLDAGRRPALLERLPRLLERVGEDGAPLERTVVATACVQQAIMGAGRAEVLALAERALGDGALLAEEGPDGTTVYGLTTVLCVSDELAWEDRVLTAAIAEARARGSVMGFATASFCRGGPRWAQGRLAEALADVEQAVDAERYGWRHFLPSAYGLLVGLHLDRGEIDAAAERAGSLDPADYAGSGTLALFHEARGRLALVQHRNEDALAEFSAWRDVTENVANPAFLAAWRSSSARALMRLGRVDEARALAGEELELVRRFGAPRAISVALRALAHAESGTDVEGGIALLREAIEIVEPSEAILEHSRALLELGIALRRAGRRSDAGRALGSSLEIARSCGARLLEERAADELEVAGARVQRAALRGADALSPSERRVVALAVDGLSNREIAEALFVTRKAVEWHLGNAYRKLDVRSRRDLPAALSGTEVPPSP